MLWLFSKAEPMALNPPTPGNHGEHAREAMADGEFEWRGRLKIFEGMESKKEKEFSRGKRRSR